MKQRKYGEEVYEFLCKNASFHKLNELSTLIKEKFNIDIPNEKLTKYMWTNKIQYKKTNGIKYTQEFYNFMKQNAKNYTLNELIVLTKEKFNIDTTKETLYTILRRKNIKPKFKYPNLSHSNKPTEIGTIVIDSHNLLKIKTAPHKWEYLQRKIYEDYYNIKLPNNMHVVFLDNNTRNFNIENLKAVSNRCSAMLGGRRKLKSTNPEITKLGIEIAKLKLKINDINKNKGE